MHGVALFFAALGHGNMNHPPSSRQGIAGKTVPGNLGGGGYCEQPWGPEKQPFQHNDLNGACMLFSQPSVKQPTAAIIPGPPTLNASKWRTVNVDVSSGPGDWTRIMPWRSPGAAPVLGSGCGVAGGGVVWNANGGWPARGMAQGADPLATLPKGTPTVWPLGSNQTVAFGIWANHGGGYSYRLCKNEPGQVTEQCFQRTPLAFAGETTMLRHINGSEVEIPRVMVDQGTTPAGSQWARVPFPECKATPCTDSPQECCKTHGLGDICDELAYPEPIPNTHGFGHNNDTRVEDGFHDYSIVDQVAVPAGLEPGEYLMSWRWDCEQTTQIWQNCADVLITANNN
eukprot:g6735.t1